LSALAAVSAEAYSFGEPNNTPDGTPNTFIFAFAGVGGAPIASLLNPSIPTVGTAGLVGLAVLLAGFAAARVRRRVG
jgi:type IV pilus assembly protein PilY1